MTPCIEAVKALDGKIFAILNSDEQAALDFYCAQGRKHGVSIQIENKADPAALASAKDEAELRHPEKRQQHRTCDGRLVW